MSSSLLFVLTFFFVTRTQIPTEAQTNTPTTQSVPPTKIPTKTPMRQTKHPTAAPTTSFWSTLDAEFLSKVQPYLFRNTGITIVQLTSIPPKAFNGLTRYQMRMFPASLLQ
jgi:hypothetical protein